MTMEATVGKLPSTLELGPEVVALAQQRHTVGLQVVHTRGRSRLHLPRLVLGGKEEDLLGRRTAADCAEGLGDCSRERRAEC